MRSRLVRLEEISLAMCSPSAVCNSGASDGDKFVQGMAQERFRTLAPRRYGVRDFRSLNFLDIFFYRESVLRCQVCGSRLVSWLVVVRRDVGRGLITLELHSDQIVGWHCRCLRSIVAPLTARRASMILPIRTFRIGDNWHYCDLGVTGEVAN